MGKRRISLPLVTSSQFIVIDNPANLDQDVRVSVTDFFASENVQTILSSVVTASAPYKSYTALLTQSGVSAPVATVLQNTLGLGTVTFSYIGAGNYRAIVSGGFPALKTVCFIGQDNGSATGLNYCYPVDAVTVDNVVIQSKLTDGTTGQDDKLYYTSIEIRVYP